MIGGGYQLEKLKELKLKLNLENIIFLPFQEYSVIPESLTSADLAIVSISKDSEEIITPSKMYGHLAAGTPIALISPKELRKYKNFINEKNNLYLINNFKENIDINTINDWKNAKRHVS